jgi:hypothetical protein
VSSLVYYLLAYGDSLALGTFSSRMELTLLTSISAARSNVLVSVILFM